MQGVDGPRCQPLLALLVGVGSDVMESTKLVEREGWQQRQALRFLQIIK